MYTHITHKTRFFLLKKSLILIVIKKECNFE